MTVSIADLQKRLKPLNEWWEGAGVAVDTREIERALNGLQKVERSAPLNQAATHTAGEDKALDTARALARKAENLDALKQALAGFEGSYLKQQATNTVFTDGAVNADIMVLGEGPAREDDLQGKPFVGDAGQLLDKMLASIGLSRETDTLITNVNYWRPPGNRNPNEDELALCRPFVERTIALTQPKLIIAAGAVTAKALLGVSDGIMKLRGKDYPLQVEGLTAPIPVFPMFHPAYLLRRPAEKSRAWADLLNILSRLEEIGIAPKSRP